MLMSDRSQRWRRPITPDRRPGQGLELVSEGTRLHRNHIYRHRSSSAAFPSFVPATIFLACSSAERPPPSGPASFPPGDMLPVFLVLSILAFFDGACAVPRWRPDLRRNAVNVSPLHRRRVLEGNATDAPVTTNSSIATDAPVTTNSTIVPVVLASDKQ